MNKAAPPLKEIGPTFADCVENIRKKHGNNYQIVDKRTEEISGLFGIGKKRQMVVTYIVTDYSALQQGFREPSRSGNGVYGQPSGFSEERDKILVDLMKKKSNSENTQKEFSEISQKLELLQKRMEDLIPQQSQSIPSIKKIEEILEQNEFSSSYINYVVEKIRSEFSLEELEDFNLVQNKVIEWIGENITLFNQNELSKKPLVLILVGPTGVGKTTTVAKMAAKYRVDGKDSFIRMVSIDCFRIAAQEQLSIYGGHMDIPTTAAETAEDIERILQMDGNRLDVMLIDTIGLSPHDFEAIGKMRKILDINGLKPEVFLAVSASTKASDLRDIMDNYEIFGYKSVIITKFDETRHIGNVLSVLREKNKSVAFISLGQVVPRDFETASVLRFLMQLSDFKIDRKSLETKFSPLPGDAISKRVDTSDGGTL